MEIEAEMMMKKLSKMDVEERKPREAWWILEKKNENEEQASHRKKKTRKMKE